MSIKAARAAYDAGNYLAAFQLFQPLATQGDATAQEYLEEMLRDDNVNIICSIEIGEHYFEEEEYVDAAKWYRKAAEIDPSDPLYLGCESLQASACESLGQMYLKGQGVNMSETEAAKWFCKGAKNDRGCMESFNELYMKGIRVAEDECELAKMYHQAVEEGDRTLQIRLGLTKPTIRDFNKLAIFAIGGLAALLFLALYDGITIYHYVINPVSGIRGESYIFSVVGFLYGFKASYKKYYLNPDAWVTGIPFPTTFSETSTFGGDTAEPIYGYFSFVAVALNCCFYSLLLLAITFVAASLNCCFYILPILVLILFHSSR
ncbi:MAG: tetratricopeptide repeat protein [bacterium]